MSSKNNMIQVDSVSCIRCGLCARICPAGIVNQKEKGASIEVAHLNDCIACGHCVAVCPTRSVIHSSFPPERIHPIDYGALPSPEQVLLLIQSRRSNRVLTAKPIPEVVLKQIKEAALYAPTASNNQQVSVTIVTDPEVLKEVSRLTMEALDSVLKKLNWPLVRGVLRPFLKEVYASIPAFYRYKAQYVSGEDPILRKATALMVFHTPKSSELGCQDASLAYQNASLMAQSLGISQIFMGFVLRAIQLGYRKRIHTLLGVDEPIHALMALGIPAFRFKHYADKQS